MTIGDAQTARMLFEHFGRGNELHRRAPNGFRRIGEGCYRTAYLDKKNSVVYKIGSYEANISESEISRKLRRKSSKSLGFTLRIPHTRTYRMPITNQYGNDYPNNVIAQEFAANSNFTYCNSQDAWMAEIPPCNCKGRSEICFAEVHDKVASFSGLSDIHGANLLMDKDKAFWLIDMSM